MPTPSNSPQDLVDEAAAALAAAFAALAARLRGTLRSVCMQRWHLEKAVCAPCLRRPAAKAAPRMPDLPTIPGTLPRDSAAALDAAAAAYQRLVQAAHAEHGSLPPAAAAVSESARAACIVLLQQAQLVAAVLQEAGVPEVADEEGETITAGKPEGQQQQLQLSGAAAQNGGKPDSEGKAAEDSV